MRTRRAIVVAGVVGVCLAVAALAFVPPPVLAAQEGAASPQDVAKALQAAGKTDDFRRIVPLIHPDDRPMMAVVMLMGGGMAAAFSEDPPAVEAEFQALLKKHGLDDLPELPDVDNKKDADAAARKALEGIDLVALIPDLFDFLGRHMKQGKQDREVMNTGELTEVRIEGSTATAKAGDEEVRFGKVGDRWYIRLPAE